MKRIMVLLLGLAVSAPGFAQPQTDNASSTPPKRIRSIILYGDQPCPKGSADEIVVCAHEDDSPYRIPKQFREDTPPPAAAQSWSKQVEVLNEVNSAALPGACTVVGTAASTGCTQKMIQQWMAEKAAKQRAESQIP